eukprot:scaffold181182_cov61-Attheya_sp.AAC.2
MGCKVIHHSPTDRRGRPPSTDRSINVGIYMSTFLPLSVGAIEFRLAAAAAAEDWVFFSLGYPSFSRLSFSPLSPSFGSLCRIAFWTRRQFLAESIL